MAALIILLFVSSFLPAVAFPETETGSDTGYAPDLVKIKLTPAAYERAGLPEGLYAEAADFGIEELDRLLLQTGGQKIIRAHRRVKDTAWEERTGFDRWFLVKLDGRMAVEEAVNAFKSSAWIEFAQPEYEIRSAVASNDPFYSDNWGHNNTAQLPAWFPAGDPAGGHTGATVGTVGFDSDAQLAWDRSQFWGSSSIVIAIIDTGADTSHPDLRLVAGYDYGDGDSNVNTTNAHGTNCAGIAAARANNSLGVAGIAGGCSIMPLKILDSAGHQYFTYTDNALTHAADNGVEIISMSFSAIPLGTDEGDIPATDAALEYAYDHGCVMFASTANDNTSTIGYPSNHNKVISVGAAAPNGARKSYTSVDGEYWWGSNYGVNTQDDPKAVDLMAPTILPSTDLMGTAGYNTSASPGGDYYMWFNGTSCSCPYAAGVAALLLSKTPTLTQTQVKNILSKTATDMTVGTSAGWDRYTGYGLVNADRALVNVWDGSSSNAWNLASNWSLDMVPISTQDVLIPNYLIRYPTVSVNPQPCASVVVESAASITITTGYLTAFGDYTTSGSLVMNNSTGHLYVLGQLSFESGATASITADVDIHVVDDVFFQTGSNVIMSNGNLILYGNKSSVIRAYTAATVYNLLSDKDSGYSSAISLLSTAPITISGNLYVYGGSTLNHSYSGTTILKGGMWVYDNATCAFNSGTLSLEGTGTSYLRFYQYGIGNHLKNLAINKSTGYSVVLYDTLEVAGNVTINSGTFNPGTWPVFVGGNWDNNAGPAYFTEGSGTVIFNGTGNQYVYTETFNVLKLDKSTGSMYITTGNTVGCNSYDWDAGAYVVNGGTFNVLDLADSGIFGTITISSGTVNYLQDSSQYVDMRCTLNLSGGTFNINGGNSTSWWGFVNPFTLNMSNGTLYFYQPIYIPSSHTTVENITGGIIRTCGSFSCQRGDFTPSGGTLEMYDSLDMSISMATGSNLYNLNINKNPAKSEAPDHSGFVQRERDGTPLPQTRSNTALAGSDLIILHDFTISTGGFDANGYDLTVGGTWDNNGLNTLAFTAGIGTVYLNQAGDIQNVYGPNVFNILIDNHSGAALTFNDATTIDSLEVNNIVSFHNANTINNVDNSNPGAILAFYYNYASTIGSYTGGGSLRAWISSYVTINDLTQPGLYGSYIAGSGHLEFHQDASSFSDINGNMTIQDNGIVDIYGTYSDCYIGYDGDCLLTITSGELNIKENSFYIENNGNTVDFAVSGGTIRVNGSWYDSWGIFDPSGGTVEMTGATDNHLTCHASSWFHTLTVNKVLAREAEPGPEFETDREGNVTPVTRACNLTIHGCTVNGGYIQTAAGAVYLTGDLNSANGDATNIITAGTLRLNGSSFISAGNLTIYGILAVDPASTLYIGGTKALNVYSGGYLLLGGNSSSPATITKTGTGTYGLYIRNGGMIGAVYGIFEYMNVNGLYLYSGSSVNTDYCLENCTFRNGAGNGRLLTISNSQNFIVSGAVFPANTWGGYYNAYKSVDSGVVYFSNWSGDFGGEDHDYDPNNRIFWEGSGSPDIENLQISHIPATNKIRLDWSYPLEDASFRIYRSSDPYGMFNLVGTTADLFWEQTVPGPYYFYRVRAVLP